MAWYLWNGQGKAYHQRSMCYANGYPADEAYFLHDIIHTIDLVLTGHPHLDAERLGAWVAQRHAQIEQGALVYIAHQLDVLGRMTAPMGEEQHGKP